MPEVSTIIPVYNNSKYLEDCFNSLVSQTLKDIEIIAIDDASTDNSYEILKSYQEKYPNIHVYKNETNKGQGATRNRGLELATGEYIGFVDSDDFIDPKMYETMYEGAKKNNYPDIITTGIAPTKQDEKFQNTTDNIQRREGCLQSIKRDPMIIFWESPACWNKIFRKDKIKDLKFLTNCMWEDIAFTYSMMAKSDTVLSFANPDYHYRRDITRGVSSKGYQVNDHILDIFRVEDELEKEAKKESNFEELKEVIRMIQVSGCIQRIKEISTWNISDDKKRELMQNIYNLTEEKYGPIASLDQALLSSKVDLDIITSLKKQNHTRK